MYYTRCPVIIEWYNDANWIYDIKDLKSTSRYVFTLASVAISWKSFKQTIIAKSTKEYEIIGLNKCGKEPNSYTTSYRIFQNGQTPCK